MLVVVVVLVVVGGIIIEGGILVVVGGGVTVTVLVVVVAGVVCFVVCVVGVGSASIVCCRGRCYHIRPDHVPLLDLLLPRSQVPPVARLQRGVEVLRAGLFQESVQARGS